MREGLEEHFEALGEAVDELEDKEKASNALAALKSATQAFKGTWSGEGR